MENLFKSKFSGIWLFVLLIGCTAKKDASAIQVEPLTEVVTQTIVTGAERLDFYLPFLDGKRVAMVVNQTSMVNNTHLVDTLLAKGVNIVKIFSPEHGFRGDADAGEAISNSTDARTGLSLVSLYGLNKKPTENQLADVDVVIFDIQDVGARFYTYISTMHYVMEACATYKKEVLVLDRPNPNGHYVDGPVREDKFQSFVGMHPIPIVHGLTVAELARMINGEQWLAGGLVCELKVVPCLNYTHSTPYSLPVKPSPNLPNDLAIALYPSLCLFEGTKVSVGRGTDSPFQLIGSPKHTNFAFSFTPVSTPGAKYPMYENEVCYGKDFRISTERPNGFSLQEVIEFYETYPDKNLFFNDFFDKLVGNSSVRKQIIEGKTEAEIKQAWGQELAAFKAKRKQYLLYPDFED